MLELRLTGCRQGECQRASDTEGVRAREREGGLGRGRGVEEEYDLTTTSPFTSSCCLSHKYTKSRIPERCTMH